MARDRERNRLRCIEYRKRKAAEEGRVYRPRTPGSPATPGPKRCTSCKSVKPLEEFHKNRHKKFKDGHGNQCKACKRIERHERYLRTHIPRPRKPRKPRVLIAEEVEERRNRERERGRKMYAANREKILLRLKERDRRISESLSDAYIKKLITKGTDLRYRDIPHELIDVWRLRIILHRALKKQKEAAKCMTSKESTT